MSAAPAEAGGRPAHFTLARFIGPAVSLTDQEVRKLALLARLDISDDEAATVRPQLDSILQFVEKLSELDTDEVEPMTTALDVENRWRVDRVTPGLDNQQAVANAPASAEGCFLVPAVLGSPGSDS